jgi:hypothetical protein
VNSLHGFLEKSQQKHDFLEKANKIKEIFASFL